jgi:hypothetical protein
MKNPLSKLSRPWGERKSMTTKNPTRKFVGTAMRNSNLPGGMTAVEKADCFDDLLDGTVIVLTAEPAGPMNTKQPREEKPQYWIASVGVPPKWWGTDRVGIAAEDIDEAIGRVREMFPGCMVWSCTHQGSIDCGIQAREEETPCA